MIELWRGRLGTARAMAALCGARLLIACLPFHRWRKSLGSTRRLLDASSGTDGLTDAAKLATQVNWAAERLPFASRCLPRAVALSWLLRRQQIGHEVVIAARPADLRNSADALHAWVEMAGVRLIGDLPGPWLEALRLGES